MKARRKRRNLQPFIPMTTADVEKYADAVYPGLAPNFVTWAESYRWPACRREPNLAEALVKISDLKKRAEARESGVARDILIWGGLRKVKDSSITGNLVADLIDTPKENARVRVATSFGRSVLKDSRLASWTKILAMRYPKDFFIFDSRVSNALNKLLCSSSLNGKLAEAGVRCFFPSLPAQSTTGMLAAEQKANIDALKGKEKHMKPFSDCAVLYFDLYCPLIKKLARRLYEDPEVNTVPLEEVFRPYLVGLDENFRKETLPHLVEMALFMYGKPEGKSCGCQRKVNPD